MLLAILNLVDFLSRTRLLVRSYPTQSSGVRGKGGHESRVRIRYFSLGSLVGVRRKTTKPHRISAITLLLPTHRFLRETMEYLIPILRSRTPGMVEYDQAIRRIGSIDQRCCFRPSFAPRERASMPGRRIKHVKQLLRVGHRIAKGSILKEEIKVLTTMYQRLSLPFVISPSLPLQNRRPCCLTLRDS